MDDFRLLLDETSTARREQGHAEFRLAAMRMFESLQMPAQALAVSVMVVDHYLTKDELAGRVKA